MAEILARPVDGRLFFGGGGHQQGPQGTTLQGAMGRGATEAMQIINSRG